jgi:hypothetical protein
MTIQQRSHRASERYGEPDFEPNYKQQDLDMDDFGYGVSIYREAKDGGIDEAIHQIGNSCPSYLISKRGKGSEISSAVNIMETGESRRILELGNVAFRAVNDHLYHNVPSLRTTIKVETDSVELFGWEHTPYKTIGITIKEPSQLLQERADSFKSINELVFSDELCKYSLLKTKIPHISLAKIDLYTPQSVIDKTKEAVRYSMPSELFLKRALILKNGSK